MSFTNLEIEKKFKSVFNELKKQNFDLAIEDLKKILIIDIHNLKAKFLLGTVYLQNKNFNQSFKLLSEVIRLNPKFAEAHNNIGLVYKELNNLNLAKRSFVNAIDLKSDYIDAHNNLGVIYRELGDFNNAIRSTELSLKYDPNYILAYNNLGLIYKNLNSFEKSEKYFLKAIEINNKFSLAFINLMELYEKTNQLEKLSSIIAQTENLDLINSTSQFYKSNLFYKKGQFKEAINILNSIKFKISENAMEQSRASLLAKCYDKENDIENAFNYFEIKNKIALKFQKKEIDKNIFINEIKDRLEFCSYSNHQNISNIKSAYKFTPIFMIGFPRSGTTLLDTILRSHPKIEVIEEKPMVTKLIKSITNLTNNNLKNIYNIKEAEIIKLREIYYNDLISFTDNFNPEKIYIDKLPLNIIYIAEIIRIFPNAKFIFSIRNPYDCVLSCFMQDFKPNNAMANFINLEDAAKTYDLVLNLFFKYKSRFSFCLHEIKYENIVLDFKKEITLVLKFLQLDWDNSVMNYQIAAKKRNRIFTPSYDQVTKPLYSNAIGRWKRYKNKLNYLSPLLQPWAKKLSYEQV